MTTGVGVAVGTGVTTGVGVGTGGGVTIGVGMTVGTGVGVTGGWVGVVQVPADGPRPVIFKLSMLPRPYTVVASRRNS